MKRVFSDGRVTIRAYEAGDVEPLFDAVRESLAALMPWMPWCHPDYSPDDSRAWVETRDAAWQAGEEYSFAITDSATGEFCGGVGLNHLVREYRMANLGYWVRTTRAGRGMATAATRLAAGFAFNQLALTRVEIIMATGNVASRRVAEKAGGLFEGTLRNRIILDGQPAATHLFSLVPEE